MKKLISLILVLILTLAAVSAALAEETVATPIDKEAFDALLAAGPVASDEAIAASTWATKVKEAGILRVGGTRTSFLSASWTKQITVSADLTRHCISCWPGTFWAMPESLN